MIRKPVKQVSISPPNTIHWFYVLLDKTWGPLSSQRPRAQSPKLLFKDSKPPTLVPRCGPHVDRWRAACGNSWEASRVASWSWLKRQVHNGFVGMLAWDSANTGPSDASTTTLLVKASGSTR
ncbi:hypothetical protein TIFTF001_005880 [Ficus carica]|uniref:Uncharacterized protein n=1 Tax=Ficus carica TaxID=3494 RepID=A0AA87ZMN5_FICCA|nr:hypothetical protein TIFTF001_005880 [Ficus carica]